MASCLAVRSRLLRDFLTEELERQEQEDEGGKLLGLFKAFKEQVSHELTIKDFADAFAQTLAYGLFLAKLNVKKGVTLTLSNADEHVPGGFSLIRELVGFLKELDREEYRDIKWVVEEVLSIVNWLDVDAVREDLSFKKRRAYSRGVRARSEEEWRLFSKDPFVYFYEDYLAKYDSKLRKSRGVYYTPPPIVNFIVRAINDILKDTFEIEQGLADRERVTVLDFACGTGTFLVEVLERIFDEIGGPEQGVAPAYVREHILKNIYGFEYLIAPYTIAHLKLSQYLSELAATAKNPNIALKPNERFQVFLTNTLEPIEPQEELFLPSLTKETKAASKVKKQPILVITGNPPYAYDSPNRGEWITQQIEAYRQVDGARLDEQVHQALHDDYVKFIRFAQTKMSEVPEGVVGVITNHTWLDSPTLRGMRQSLMSTFDRIYVLDLHGNFLKKEKAPDGGIDQNVFDIKQGVAISLFVKKAGIEKGVWRGDLWGKQLHKYEETSKRSLSEIDWVQVAPISPMHLFIKQDVELRAEYELGRSLTDILAKGGSGMMTSRDHLTVHFDKGRVWDTVVRFAAVDEEDARREFDLGRDARDWTVPRAQADLRQEPLLKDRISAIHYRPLDIRYTYRTGRARGFLGWPVNDIWRTLDFPNVTLAVSRMTKGEDFAHALVSDKMVEKICLSSKTSNNAFVFPLWSAPGIENLAADFRAFVDARYANHYAPEQILGYIYAILHAPTYRSRYAEFLRIDFPRIPFAESSADFEKLSTLGAQLVEAHLLRKMKPRGLGKYQGVKQGEDQDRVLEVRYVEAEQAVYINDAQRFAPVPPGVWNFHIGGYHVLDKYLKSRRTRVLTLDELEHVAKVADVLAFTIEQMAAIDEAYRAAFPQQA